MTLTRNELKGLKAEGTKLEKKVINMLLDFGDVEEIENHIKDVLQHGCQSGIVSELIYYNDTLAFYEKYKKDINNLLVETMDETGAKNPSEIFGNKWDSEDYFAEDTNNQNLLAWFAYEETVRKIAYSFEMDI